MHVEVDDREPSASQNADALAAEERSLLELAASGTSLAAVLDSLARFIEAQSSDGVLASILLLDRDGVHLQHGAAPSLPIEYTEAIDGTAIGPTVGSCGTAAYLAREVVVSDIRNDPLWKDFAALAGAHGLRACWSTPILSTTGEVLGTFALYRRVPHEPTDQERELVRIATHLAGIAVERARAEEDVHASEARKSAILESALDCVITLDHDGRVLEFNAAAERTFGRRSEDVLGRELAELIVPPQLREHHRAALARWSRDEDSDLRGNLLGKRIEVTALRANGEEFPVELTVARLELAGPPMFTATLRDISDRKDAEARLLEVELRYRALVEHLPLITYIDALDDQSSNIYTSPQVESLLGYTVEEWQSDASLFVKTLHPDDRDRVLIAHAESHALGAPLTIEYRLIARDGRTVWVRTARWC